MEESTLRALLQDLQAGSVSVDEALQRLRELPYELVGNFARIDHHRALRKGFPEVIFGQGKAPEHLLAIFQRLAERSERVLATRVSVEVYEQIRQELPDGTVYHPLPRALIRDTNSGREKLPGVVVATGGTADLPVAEEAALTAELMGNEVTRLYDVGVAGIHRLLDQTSVLQRANAVVVAAGMEGALASVVGGLVEAPVIAVPTSVGYGASFHGVAALLAMLNSCATGIAVVNIDNGFGAGYLAGLINRMAAPKGDAA